MGIGEFFLMFYVGNKILQGQMTLEKWLSSLYMSVLFTVLCADSKFAPPSGPRNDFTVKIFDLIDDKVAPKIKRTLKK